MGVLEFPDVMNARSTCRSLKQEQPLPNLRANLLRQFATVLVKFHLRYWKVGLGGISAIVHRVICIDKELGPDNLKEETDSVRLSVTQSPSKRRKEIA